MGNLGAVTATICPGSPVKRDEAGAIGTAIVNKRASGAGLITDRQAFQHLWTKATDSSTPGKRSTAMIA